MPAFLPIHGGQVGLWQMPFVRTREAARSHGPVAQQAQREAEEALGRIENDRSVFWSEYARRAAVLAPMVDPIAGGDELRAYAASQGIDFDALVDQASLHFASDTIQRRTKPFSSEELEFLFEDDQRALDR